MFFLLSSPGQTNELKVAAIEPRDLNKFIEIKRGKAIESKEKFVNLKLNKNELAQDYDYQAYCKINIPFYPTLKKWYKNLKDYTDYEYERKNWCASACLADLSITFRWGKNKKSELEIEIVKVNVNIIEYKF